MKDMYALVVPRNKILKHVSPFVYGIPNGVSVRPGDIVRVPFRKKALWGIVWALEHRRPTFPVRDILERVEAYSVDQKTLGLLDWFATYYFVSLPTAAHTFLPDFTLKPPTYTERSVDSAPVRVAKYRVKEIRRLIEVIKDVDRACVRIGKRGETLAFYKGLISHNPSTKTLILTPDLKSAQELAGVLRSFSPLVVTGELNRGDASAAWIEARTAPLTIGTRLAAFLPFGHLDTVIIDNDHDQSHKNYGGNPRYDVREVAEQIASAHQAQTVVVSPTPRVDAWHRATKRISITQLSKSTTLINLNPTEGLLSVSLRKVLASEVPALVIFNRKGLMRLRVCKSCRHAYATDVLACPSCNGTDSFEAGLGLDVLQERFSTALPNKRIGLWDADRGMPQGCDITLATSVALGADLSTYKAVVLLLADQFLGAPSYRANETAFHAISWLSQVHIRTYIQSFNPDSPVIQAALAQDYERFYQAEIEQRKLFGYPPFGSMIQAINKTTGESEIFRNPAELQALSEDIIIDRTPD